MNKLLCGLLLTFSTPLYAQHSVDVSFGSTDFSWEEFRPSFEDGTDVIVADESGELATFDIGYRYTAKNQSLRVAYQSLSGDVDYLGLPTKSTIGVRRPTTTSYTVQGVSAEYGAWFDVDYIKPYMAVLGGYQQRERIIQTATYFSNRNAEDFSFFFWGLQAEAEIFSWNNFTWDVGGKYLHTLGGENESIDNGYTIKLKAFHTLGLFTRFNYEFLPTWEASFIYAVNQGEMKTSSAIEVEGITDPIRQPESEEKTSVITVQLSKTF